MDNCATTILTMLDSRVNLHSEVGGLQHHPEVSMNAGEGSSLNLVCLTKI
jgi:hypothetical protein